MITLEETASQADVTEVIVMIAQLAARQEVVRQDLEAQHAAQQKSLNNGLKEVINQITTPMGK